MAVVKNKHHSLDNFPIFSVIIPSHKRPLMLKRAVQSVLNQTLQCFEIIIVIDGYDTNYDYVQEYHENPYIKVIVSEVRNGVTASRNLGIQMAKGEYISFLDDDDEYFDDFLSTTYSALKDSNNEVALSWCNVRHVNYSSNDSNDPHTEIMDSKYQANFKSKQELLESFMSIGAGYGVTYKAESLKKIGLFSNKFTLIEDTEIFFRTIINGYVPKLIPEVKVTIHNHKEFRLTNNMNNKIRIESCKLLLDSYEQGFNKYTYLRNQICNHINYLMLVEDGA